MEKQLRQSIVQTGSKPGVYNRLAEIPALQKWIPPYIIVEPGKSLTKNQRDILRRILEESGCKELLLRPSEQSDWKGNVGTMSTHSSTFKDIDATLDQAWHDTKKGELLKYSEMEGNGYDPNNVRMLIAPRYEWGAIDRIHGCLTEDPHDPKRVYVDIFSEYDDFCLPLSYRDGILEKTLFSVDGQVEKFREGIQQALQMHNECRETGIFPDIEEDALQWEFGLTRRGEQPVRTLLFQTRWFAKSNLIDKESYNIKPRMRTRDFRVFGESGTDDIELPVLHVDHLYTIQKQDAEMQEPYVMGLRRPCGELAHDYAKNMLGYIPNGNGHIVESLQHQATRYVMHCLQRGGFAILGRSPYEELPKEGSVTIVCNGEDYEIRAVA